MNDELKNLFEIKEQEKSKIKDNKINYTKHLFIWFGIPVVIMILIWQNKVGANLDQLFLQLVISSIVLFVTCLLLIIQTISLNQNKIVKLRKINYCLLTLYLLAFVFFIFCSIVMANF